MRISVAHMRISAVSAICNSESEDNFPLILVAFRFETLEPEMNNLSSRIAAVNDIANHLLGTDHRNKESIQSTQEQLNTRWVPGRRDGIRVLGREI